MTDICKNNHRKKISVFEQQKKYWKIHGANDNVAKPFFTQTVLIK